MAIQAQLNANQIGFPLIGGGVGSSEFSLINSNGGIGIGIDQSQKDLNQQTLFHHHHHQHQHQNQQYRSQSFLDAHMEKQKQEIDQFIRIQVCYQINHIKIRFLKTWVLIKI